MVLKVSAAEGSEHHTLARLQHTNIVPIFSVHEDERAGLRAVCMPYFGGGTLSRILEQLWDQDDTTDPGRATGRGPRGGRLPGARGEERRARGRRGVRTSHPRAAGRVADAAGPHARPQLLQGGRLDRGPTCRGAPSRPSTRHPPPGCQAVEYPAQRRGAAAPAGFQRGRRRWQPAPPRQSSGGRWPTRPRSTSSRCGTALRT